MKPMLLTFNMAPEHVARLRFMCMKMGAVVQPVAPQDFTQTLGTLCGMAPGRTCLPRKHPLPTTCW